MTLGIQGNTASADIAENVEDKYRDLLADYSAISSRRSGAAAAFALRHRARGYRDIMAFQATGGKCTYMQLKQQVDAKIDLKDIVTDAKVLAELGRVAMLQEFDSHDRRMGEVLLVTAIDMLPNDVKSRTFRRLLVQFDILSSNFARAAHLLELYPDVQRDTHDHLSIDMLNPYINPSRDDVDQWLRQFNEVLTQKGLLPLSLAPGEEPPFDRLTAMGFNEGDISVAQNQERDSTHVPVEAPEPLVSIIMTSYRPQRESILNSVKSLLAQTWSNLEIVVVDDSSGPDYEHIYRELEFLDNRIRIIQTPHNSGTYAARNLGFGQARGAYLTGQDDDDWSHPERVQEQVRYLESTPEAAGCRVYAIACDESMRLTRLGKRTPYETNASSLMLTREVWNEVGGFLEVRKAADTELSYRVERVTRRTISDIEMPLTLIRKASGSLSHSEFTPGWSHPARRAFKASYGFWHSNASYDELTLRDGKSPNISIPLIFQSQPEDQVSQFDVIFAGDWHPFGGPQRSMLEEIKALLSVGKKVGILHMDPARFMRTRERELSAQILDLVNSGQVTNVLYDDPVETQLLILRYPPIMQFPPVEPSAIKTARTLILANQAPEETDGRDIRYIPRMVQENTERVFSAPTTWVPQSFMVRAELRNRLPKELIESFDFPGILNVDEWYVKRSRFRSSLPVVGRHSRDNAMKWPERRTTLTSVYPIDGTFDVRVLGGGDAALRVLKQESFPGNWSVYGPDEIAPERFLATLDFYVFFQHSKTVEAFGRSVLEAIASGLAVVLPDKFEPVFGEAAIYAEPEDVITLIRDLHQDRARYDAHIAKSQRVLFEHFSYNSYIRQINGLLEEKNEALV